jgi:hypothetical protein
MHRLPNPPKLPVTALAETRSRGGLRVAKARLGVMLLPLLAACASIAAESRADEGLAALDRHYAITSLASVSSAWKEVAPINTLGLSERGR